MAVAFILPVAGAYLSKSYITLTIVAIIFLFMGKFFISPHNHLISYLSSYSHHYLSPLMITSFFIWHPARPRTFKFLNEKRVESSSIFISGLKLKTDELTSIVKRLDVVVVCVVSSIFLTPFISGIIVQQVKSNCLPNFLQNSRIK